MNNNYEHKGRATTKQRRLIRSMANTLNIRESEIDELLKGLSNADASKWIDEHSLACEIALADDYYDDDPLNY